MNSSFIKRAVLLMSAASVVSTLWILACATWGPQILARNVSISEGDNGLGVILLAILLMAGLATYRALQGSTKSVLANAFSVAVDGAVPSGVVVGLVAKSWFAGLAAGGLLLIGVFLTTAAALGVSRFLDVSEESKEQPV